MVKENLFRRLAPSLILSILGGLLLHAIDRPGNLTSGSNILPTTLPSTPPQTSNGNNQGDGNSTGTIPSSSPTNPTSNSTTNSTTNSKDTPAPKKSKKPTPSATTKPNQSPTATNNPTPSPATTSNPQPTPSKTSIPKPTGYSGTLTGNSSNARNYGTVSATVTFKDGKISNVSAFQNPSSWSQNSLPSLLDYVNNNKITIEQVKSISAEQLPCAIGNSCRSQASFTATAFWVSVKSAISKAGL